MTQHEIHPVQLQGGARLMPLTPELIAHYSDFPLTPQEPAMTQQTATSHIPTACTCGAMDIQSCVCGTTQADWAQAQNGTAPAPAPAVTFEQVGKGRAQVIQGGKPIGVVRYQSACWWAYDMQGDKISGGYNTAAQAWEAGASVLAAAATAVADDAVTAVAVQLDAMIAAAYARLEKVSGPVARQAVQHGIDDLRDLRAQMRDANLI